MTPISASGAGEPRKERRERRRRRPLACRGRPAAARPWLGGGRTLAGAVAGGRGAIGPRDFRGRRRVLHAGCARDPGVARPLVGRGDGGGWRILVAPTLGTDPGGRGARALVAGVAG